MPGLQFEPAPLRSGERRALPVIGLFFLQYVPDDECQFARRRDGGDLLAAPRTNPGEERVQWAWRMGCGPRRLDQHRAGLGAPALADVPVLGRSKTRLSYFRIEPEVAHKLCRRGETCDVPDRCAQRNRHRDVDSRDGEEPSHLGILLGGLSKRALDDDQVLPQTVDLTQPLLNAEPLIERQRLIGEPRPSPLAKQIARRAARNEVCHEHRLDLVLQPCALTYNLLAPRRLST